MRVLFLALALVAGAAAAQGYPAKPVRIVVPYAAGGSADITARVIAQKLSDSLKASFVVENKGGANGMVGTEVVAKAAPDGYTLLLVASGPIVVNPALYPKVPYDPVKDLAPIVQATTYQYVLVVPSSSKLSGITELIAEASARPGELSYGSAGVGGGNHLAAELLALMTKTRFNHIPYKGSAPALADLLGGQLTFMFDTVVTSVPHIYAGRLRPFAVSGPKRASVLPKVPTMAEAGFRGFDITQWQGFFAPAGADAKIIEKLNAEIVKALKLPDVVERLEKQGGNEIVGGTPADFAELIADDLRMYSRLIREAGIKPE